MLLKNIFNLSKLLNQRKQGPSGRNLLETIVNALLVREYNVSKKDH